MKKILSTFLLLFLIITASFGQELLGEFDWAYYDLDNGESALSVIHGDDLQFPVGSAPLNPGVNYENFNGTQMTIRWNGWLYFVPGDGVGHTFLDTKIAFTTNRVAFYISTIGHLEFYIYDKDSTGHGVVYDVTGWTIGEEHQIVATFDFNNDTMGIYVDGSLEDDTGHNLSSDSIDAIDNVIYYGQNTINTGQLNGSGTLQIYSDVKDAAWVTADWNSGDGVPFVVDSDTILMARFTNESTDIIYHHSGKLVSNIISGGTEATLTTADGAEVFEDGVAVLVQDGTGYSKPGFADGAGSGTTLLVDDGAGGAVASIETVGVSMFCDSTYYAQGGDVLDITTEDFEISFWMRQNGDPASTKYCIGKASGAGTAQSYLVYLHSTGKLTLRADDGTNDGIVELDITEYLDDKWHHYYVFADRSAIATCAVYVDGISKTISTIGTFPVLTLTNAIDFTVAARYTGGNILEGYIRDARIKIGGTMASAAQVLYQATHPFDYSASSWNTADGTREYWEFSENTGTTIPAGVTSPGNDLTLSSADAWDLTAFVTKILNVDPGFENGGIGGIADIATTWVISKDSESFKDALALKAVCAAGDDNDEFTIHTVTAVANENYRDKFWIWVPTIQDDTKLYRDWDGAATPILSREVGKSLGDNGEFARDFNLDATYYAQAANNTIHNVTTEDVGVWAWVKVNTTGGAFSTIVSKIATSAPFEGYVLQVFNNNMLRLTITEGAGLGSSAYRLEGNTQLNDGEWHLVAGIIDRNNAVNCKLYIDGVEDGTTNKTGTLGDVGSITNTGKFEMGSLINGIQLFDGYIRDAGICYPADIMAAGELGEAGAIAAMYANPSDLTQYPNFEDWWPCNDNAASTVVTGDVNNLAASANTNVFAEEHWKMYEQCWEADQAVITAKMRITATPVVAVTRTVNTGTESSGSLSDTWVQDGTDYEISEVVGVPGFDIEFTFNVTSDPTSFNLYGYYDGNAGHTVDVNAWDGGAWDTLGQLPDAVADTLYSFTLDGTHNNAGVVTIQIDHTSPGNVNHDLYMDYLYVEEELDATVYVDDAELRVNMVNNPGCEGGADPPTGWTQEGSATVVSDTSPHSGTNCLKVTAGAANVGASQNITLVDGKSYTVTIYAKATAGDTAALVVDTGDTTIETLGTTTSTLWTIMQGTFLATGTNGVMYVRGVANGDIVWFDDGSMLLNDYEAASTATKGDGFWPLDNPLWIPR